MRPPLPRALGRRVPAAERSKVESWWKSLDSSAKRSLRGRELNAAIELRGRFLDPEDAVENEMWRLDLIEYINNHPELRFHLEERKFHICRAHAVAREVIRTGVVPGAFVCPVRNAACPFEAASKLGDGRPLVLAARLRRRQSSTGA